MTAGEVQELQQALKRQDWPRAETLLRGLIEAGLEVRAVASPPGWGEIDSANDLAFYEAELAAGRLDLPERPGSPTPV